jgi:hypothetical protein
MSSDFFRRDDCVGIDRRDAKFFAKLILAYFHRLEKLFKQNFAWMNWGYLLCLHFFTSMIISNLYIICIPVLPLETYPPLIVYANAMLSFSISRQGFKFVGRGNPKVLDS